MKRIVLKTDAKRIVLNSPVSVVDIPDSEVPDGALNVSADGSGSGSGANSDNEMSFEDFKALVLSTGIPQDTIVSFKAGEVYDFSDFPVPVPTAPTNLRFTDITSTTQRLDWTRGPGDFIIIVRRIGAAVTWTPTEDTEYIQAQDLGSDQVVAHVGSGIFYPMSSLTADTEYHYAAWEYNTNDIEFKYSATAATVSGRTFTTEFQAGLTLALAQDWETPTLEQMIAENLSLKDFVDRGLFAEGSRFYNKYSRCTSDDWRGINWISPAVASQMLEVGGYTQLAPGGTDYNGTTGYGNCQWVPSTQGGTKFTATDAAVYCNIRNMVVGAYNIFGIWKGSAGPANFMLIPSNAGNATGRLNNLNLTGVITVANTVINGLWCVEVRALNTTFLSVDDTVLQNGTTTGAGAALPNVNFVAMARNNSASTPVIDLFADGTMDFIFMGKPTAIDREDVKDWWEAHKARIDAL